MKNRIEKSFFLFEFKIAFFLNLQFIQNPIIGSSDIWEAYFLLLISLIYNFPTEHAVLFKGTESPEKHGVLSYEELL